MALKLWHTHWYYLSIDLNSSDYRKNVNAEYNNRLRIVIQYFSCRESYNRVQFNVMVFRHCILPNRRTKPSNCMTFAWFLCKRIAIRLWQGIVSISASSAFIASTSLFTTLVCVACSQLEKLTATLLDIRQTHVTAERDSRTQTDQEKAQGQARALEELFHHMQKQLNNCIRHHQEIKRCK
jgi:hypothetical protein